jgi:hypothetical protein
MAKKIITVIFLLTYFLFTQSAYSQIQKDIPDYLKEQFLKYTEAVPWEEIYVHTDREEYIAGEDLWFNLYLQDRQSFMPSQNSRIAYFELLNSENRPVVQKRILIDKGFGPGQIILPDTLGSGRYTIRVYTSWMKNFLPYNCFMKEISVYNTLSNKAISGKLNPIDFVQKGIGKEFTPKINNTGVDMKVNNSKPDSLEIFVNTDNKFRSDNNNLFYIFIQTHGNINYVSSERITEETKKVNLPKVLLSKGINQITIFNSKGEPVSERFIYTPVKESNFITLHSIDSCDLRDKITLDIEAGNGLRRALNPSGLSISVAPQNDSENIINIDDYLIFGTEFGLSGRMLSKDGKFKRLSGEKMDSLLFTVRSNWIDWTKILSGDLPRFKYQMEKDDHLLLGKLLTNDQRPVSSNEFLIMCTPGKEAAFKYSRTDNEGNFSFNIHIDEELKDLIIMPDDISKNHKVIIESSFSDQYFHNETSADSTSGPVPSYISKLSVNHQVQKIYGIPSTGATLNRIFPSLMPARFYGKPDIELTLSDYISLPVMTEIFFELLPDVSLKKKKSTYEISITYWVDDNLFVTSPCLMIDGVIIKDPSLIANLDPEIVEKIDVIKEKYLVGRYFFSGILNVITKSGDFSSVPLPEYMIRLPYKVMDPVRSFSSPDYTLGEMKDDRIPDYRNTLYWNPSVIPDKDGKARIEFWSSDNKMDYLINIQGITQDGKAFSLQKKLKVK